MSSFYSSGKSFDALDRAFSRSTLRSEEASSHQADVHRASQSNDSSSSLSSGGAPLHAMMVPGQVVPSLDRPTPDQPFSKWEAYIVKQTQEWSDKRAKSPSPPKNSKPAIVWADQVRRSSPPQPLAYTKVSDRLALSPPVSSPAEMSTPKPRGGLLRRGSFDMLRSSPESDRNTSLPPLSISSPIITSSPKPRGGLLRRGSFDMLRSSPDSGRDTPLPPICISSPIMTTSTALPQSDMLTRRSIDTAFSRPRPEPLDLSQSSHLPSSSFRRLSPLDLPLSADDFSASLLDSFGKRTSTGSSISDRVPGPSDLVAADVPMMLGLSIDDTPSVCSRRDSWASSVDLDPAIIRTPSLLNDKWQAQAQQDRPAFLAEYGLDQEDNESDTDGSVYSNDDDASASLPSLNGCPPNAPEDCYMPPQPIFQRLETDMLSLAGHSDDDNAKQLFTPDGRSLPQLDLSSLPREKEEMIRKSRARLISPNTFKRAFSIKRQASTSGASRSADSSPSLTHSSSDESGQASQPTEFVTRMPGLVDSRWCSSISSEQHSASPATPTALSIPQAPSMQVLSSSDSFEKAADSSEGSSAMSPVFSNSASSVTSESSRDRSSLSGSVAHKKHRIGTPGLTKAVSPLAGAGSAATLDPHFSRVKTRARPNGSIRSQTPSVESISTTKKGRYPRKSGRTRITDSMPSFGSTLSVPIGSQRRASTRSLSSESSVDNHSNTSSGSSYAKVCGSDDGTAPSSISSVSSMPLRGVLRKRAPSVDSSLSSKKEVSFDLPVGLGFAPVEEIPEESLEHEQKQRSHLTLPPMKLQKSVIVETAADEKSKIVSQNDLDIARFLTSFGSNITTVESLEVLDNIHGGASDWPKREEWDSLPAYLLAYATTFLSAYADDSATLVYSADRAPASEQEKVISAPLVSQNPLYTSIIRSVFGIASWDQPLVSLSVSSAYAYTWYQGKLAGVAGVGLALLAAVQASQRDTASATATKDLTEAYSKIASVLVGSEHTRERTRNLMLARSPRASLRIILSLLALVLGALRFGSGLIFSLPGLFVGLALFVWLPAIMHQPEWAPTWLKQGNPIDAVLYDVPTDAQHAILTLRRRAASGEQLVHRADSQTISLSSTSFDHRVSQQDLQHASDVLEGAYFATHEGAHGHLIVLASRLVFRALADKAEQPISLRDELERERESDAVKGCKVTFDARLEKLVNLTKAGEAGLEMRLKNGQVFKFEDVEGRNEAFNRVLALAPQRWH